MALGWCLCHENYLQRNGRDITLVTLTRPTPPVKQASNHKCSLKRLSQILVVPVREVETSGRGHK